MKLLTIPNIQRMKTSGEKIVMVTAYDATFARMVDDAGIDMILVGDSLGMVIQGYDTTLPVTLEDVIYHTRCVTQTAKRTLVVADLPFLSYQASASQAVLSAGRAMKEGRAQAVKLEGGREMADTVRTLVDVGIPVMAHVGLRPQSVHRMGGYKIQGKTADHARVIIDEARAMEEAGAFAIVLEGIAIETARAVTDAVGVPTVGIAAGPHCDGQVLVIYDLLGMDPDFNPGFLKRYMDGYRLIADALKQYADEVRRGAFPTEEHGVHRKSSPL